MAEYLDVMKQFHRMCAKGNCSTATGCPMYPACNISQCRRIAFEKPGEFEQRVMDWAEKHPEPQYPTWAEWLKEQHIIGVDYAPRASSTTSTATTYIQAVRTEPAFYRPIPADIAEKLGIQPEEG